MCFKAFEHKEFTRGPAQRLPSFVQENAYKAEETNFLRTIRIIPPSRAPKGANIIRSQVIYQVKQSDEGNLYLKARIVTHGNKDRDKIGLKTDSTTCSPVGIRLLVSIATIKWNIAKIDFKSSFCSSGTAQSDVYALCYKRPTDTNAYQISVVVFADASHKDNVGSLSYLCGLLLGKIKEGTISHTVSWSSTKYKRPVKSIGSAEVYAIGSGIDEGKIIAQAYEVRETFSEAQRNNTVGREVGRRFSLYRL